MASAMTLATDNLEERLARLDLTSKPISSQLRASSPSFSERSSGSTEYFSGTSDDGLSSEHRLVPGLEVQGHSTSDLEPQHAGHNQVSQPLPQEGIYSYSSPTRSGVTNRWYVK